MKKNTIILSVATAGCLFFSGLTFASTGQPERGKVEKASLSLSPIVGELVTTNGLLIQILHEIMKGNETHNAQKANNRCSDGEKSYSPGYVISAGKKTLHCDTGNGYPEWVEDKS